MAVETQTSHQKLDKERAEFKRLLLENPNYFGNLKDSPLKAAKNIVGQTQYEELTCVGFNPATNLLEATIAVKLPYGYGGNLCMAGTTEYVRFFLDYGSGWYVGYPQKQIPISYRHSLYKGELSLAVLAADLERPESAAQPMFEPLR